jgi:hypothetical protein
MTGVRVNSPLVVIAPGSHLPHPEALRAPVPGYRGDRP